jgi:hypothetical protein
MIAIGQAVNVVGSEGDGHQLVDLRHGSASRGAGAGVDGTDPDGNGRLETGASSAPRTTGDFTPARTWSPAGREAASAKRGAQHSDLPLFGNGQGGAADARDFSVVLALFLRRRKTRKIGVTAENCAEIVQGPDVGHLGE